MPRTAPSVPIVRSPAGGLSAGGPTEGAQAWLPRCREAIGGSLEFLWGGLAELCYPAACVLCHGPLPAEGFPADGVPADDKQAGNGLAAESSVGGAVADEEGPRTLCLGCRRALLATATVAACGRCGRPQPPVPPLAVAVQEALSIGLDASAATGSGGDAGGSATERICPWCRKRPGEIDRTVALGMYRDVMREAVVAAKRLSFQPLALALGELLGHRVRDVWGPIPIGAVTFVPSHWWRRCGRGGCPAQLLAQQVGRIVRAPVLPILRASRSTAKQGTLGDKSRRTNVSGAFKAKKGYALLSPRVLVVDDVWTTGATLQEAAGAIREGYDAEVFAAVVARAIGTHDG